VAVQGLPPIFNTFRVQPNKGLHQSRRRLRIRCQLASLFDLSLHDADLWFTLYASFSLGSHHRGC
jgi:hypothetical protein